VVSRPDLTLHTPHTFPTPLLLLLPSRPPTPSAHPKHPNTSPFVCLDLSCSVLQEGFVLQDSKASDCNVGRLNGQLEHWMWVL